ncbi:MAG: four helix bundle protein [Nitrospirota bacterium]
MRQVRKRVNGEPDFEVYHFVFDTAREIFEEIFEASKNFPKEKLYLTDQIRRNSLSVCTSLAEAWRMKDNRTIFLSKLSDAAQAASKAQNCLELASKYNFIRRETFQRLDTKYDDIFDLLCDGTKKLVDQMVSHN